MKFEESLTSITFETLVENGCKKRKNHEGLYQNGEKIIEFYSSLTVSQLVVPP